MGKEKEKSSGSKSTKSSSSSSSSSNTVQLDTSRAIRHGRMTSAGHAVGVERIGCTAMTTGRMCATKACDPFMEGDATSSDLAAAGSGVAFYFMFVKAFAWMFLIATFLIIPCLMINTGGTLKGSLGLAILSQTMLGQMINATALTIRKPDGTYAISVPQAQLPAVYSLMDIMATVTISIGVVYMIFFSRKLRKMQESHNLGAEDYTIMVTGLERCSACGGPACGPQGCGICGCCGITIITPENLAAHFERVASAFTKDYQVARVFGHPEVFLAGGELRSIRMFQDRLELTKTLTHLQEDLLKFEKKLGLKPSKWTKREPRYLRILRMYSDHVREHRATVADEKQARAARKAARKLRKQKKKNGKDISSSDDSNSDNSSDDSSATDTTSSSSPSDTDSVSSSAKGRSKQATSRRNNRNRNDDIDHDEDNPTLKKAVSKRSNQDLHQKTHSLFTSTNHATDTLNHMARQRTATETHEDDVVGGSLDSYLSGNLNIKSSGNKKIDPVVQEAMKNFEGANDDEGFSDSDHSDDPYRSHDNSSNDNESDSSFDSQERTETLTNPMRNNHDTIEEQDDEEDEDEVNSSASSSRFTKNNNHPHKHNFKPKASQKHRNDNIDENEDIYADVESEGSQSSNDDEKQSKSTTKSRRTSQNSTASNNNRRNSTTSDTKPTKPAKPTILTIDSVPPPPPIDEEDKIPPFVAPQFSKYKRQGGHGIFSTPLNWCCMSRTNQLEWRIIHLRGMIDDTLHDIEDLTRKLTRFISSEEIDAEFQAKQEEERGNIVIGNGLANKQTSNSTAIVPSKGGNNNKPKKSPYTQHMEDPVAAFVTFESAATAKAIIQLYQMGSFEWCVRGGGALVAPPHENMKGLFGDASLTGLDKVMIVVDDDISTPNTPNRTNTPSRMGLSSILGMNKSNVNTTTPNRQSILSSRNHNKGPTAVPATPPPAANTKNTTTKSTTNNNNNNSKSNTTNNKKPSSSKDSSEDSSETDDDDDNTSKKSKNKDNDSTTKDDKDEDDENEPEISLVRVQLKYLGQHIQVTSAPPPDTVMWVNLHTPLWNRRIRQSITCIFSAALILFSFGVLYGAQILQQGGAALSGSDVSNDLCLATTDMVYYDNNIYATYSAQTAYDLDLYGNLEPTTAQLLAAQAKNRPVVVNPKGLVDANTTANLLSVVPGIFTSLYTPGSYTGLGPYDNDTCPTDIYGIYQDVLGLPFNQSYYVPWSIIQHAACGTLNNGTDAIATLLATKAGTGNIYPVLIPPTPQMKACYCQAAMYIHPQTLIPDFNKLMVKAQSYISSTSSSTTNNGNTFIAAAGYGPDGKPLSTSKAKNYSLTLPNNVFIETVSYDSLPIPASDFDTCFDWIQLYLVYSALIGVSAIVVVYTNMFMSVCIRRTADFDRNPSYGAERVALLMRMTAMQFFNTGLLALLVSAYIPALPINTPGVKYEDFSIQWYINKGPSILLTMFIQSTLPHIQSMVNFYVWRCLRTFRLRGKMRTQAELNEWYTGPQFDMTLRYAQHLTVVFVCLFYSTGMPILLFVAAVSFIFSYITDLYLFLYWYRRPPKEDARVGEAALHSVPVALVLHLLIGGWMISADLVYSISGGLTVGIYGILPGTNQFLSWWDNAINPTIPNGNILQGNVFNFTACPVNQTTFLGVEIDPYHIPGEITNNNTLCYNSDTDKVYAEGYYPSALFSCNNITLINSTGYPLPAWTNNCTSPSASPTPSNTPSPTSSPSHSSSNSPTASNTPSVTPSISVSSSNTPSASNTPSVTPSISVSSSNTPSASNTPSVTPSISASASFNSSHRLLYNIQEEEKNNENHESTIVSSSIRGGKIIPSYTLSSINHPIYSNDHANDEVISPLPFEITFTLPTWMRSISMFDIDSSDTLSTTPHILYSSVQTNNQQQTIHSSRQLFNISTIPGLPPRTISTIKDAASRAAGVFNDLSGAAGDLGIEIVERFQVPYVLPYGIFALLWFIIIVLRLFIIMFLQPCLRSLGSCCTVPIRIFRYIKERCWNPRSGCLWWIHYCLFGPVKKKKKSTDKSSKDKKSSSDKSSKDKDKKHHSHHKSIADDHKKVCCGCRVFKDPKKEEEREEEEKDSLSDQNMQEILQQLTDIHHGDLEGYIPPMKWVNSMAAKRIAIGKIPPVQEVVRALLESEQGISGGLDGGNQAILNFQKELELDDKAERRRRYCGACGCLARTFCCCCLCFFQCCCSSSGNKDKDTKKKKDKDSKKSSKDKKKDKNDKFSSSKNDKNSKSSEDKSEKKKSTKTKKKPLSIYCCGGYIRCWKAKAKPGDESEDGRFMYMKTPNYSTAFALRLLSGVPTYNPLASPRVLEILFPVADTARLARRYATITQAALFDNLDIFEDNHAVKTGGWDSIGDDLGLGTSMEGRYLMNNEGNNDDDTDKDKKSTKDNKGKSNSKHRKGKDSDDSNSDSSADSDDSKPTKSKSNNNKSSTSSKANTQTSSKSQHNNPMANQRGNNTSKTTTTTTTTTKSSTSSALSSMRIRSLAAMKSTTTKGQKNNRPSISGSVTGGRRTRSDSVSSTGSAVSHVRSPNRR